VGDDLRDIEAGRAAGMVTVACGWGYCGSIDPATWGADYLLETPRDLLQLLRELADASRAAA
jgi:phosphoglycolate phosphatase